MNGFDMTTQPPCSLCHRRAAVRVWGKYRNGREACDLRCDLHRPDSASRGSWAFFGATARLFRIEDWTAIR